MIEPVGSGEVLPEFVSWRRRGSAWALGAECCAVSSSEFLQGFILGCVGESVAAVGDVVDSELRRPAGGVAEL